MFDAKQILADQARMESERSNFDAMWQEIAELVLPRQADFTVKRSEGEVRTNKIFDSTAAQMLEQGVSNFVSHVMPRGQRYQMLEPKDEALFKLQHVMEWYELKTTQLLALRHDPRSGFINQSNESVASLLAFGPQAMWVDLRHDRVTGRPVGFRYKSEHIGSVWIDEDFQGNVVRTHRKFQLTAEAALTKWGKKLPGKVASAARDPRKRNDKFTFIHRIEVNPSPIPGRIDWRGKLWMAAYLCCEAQEVFDEGGYDSNPLIYSRFTQAPNEKYARSPAVTVLPDIKAAQQIMMDLVIISEMSAMPPLLAADDMLDQTIRYASRGVTYGGLDYRGNPTIRPLFDGGDANPMLALQESIRQVIQRAFFADMLFSNREVKTHVNVQETLERISEKGILLSPLARQETEWFGPMTDRELDLMDQMGLFDDMPGEVEEAGGMMQNRFDNPLGRAQKADQVIGYMRLLEAVAPQMQLDPERHVPILNQALPFEKVLAGMARVLAVPASFQASDDERAQAKQADDEAASTQSLLQALPAISQATQSLQQVGMAA
jgi:hypothetical protein